MKQYLMPTAWNKEVTNLATNLAVLDTFKRELSKSHIAYHSSCNKGSTGTYHIRKSHIIAWRYRDGTLGLMPYFKNIKVHLKRKDITPLLAHFVARTSAITPLPPPSHPIHTSERSPYPLPS